MKRNIEAARDKVGKAKREVFLTATEHLVTGASGEYADFQKDRKKRVRELSPQSAALNAALTRCIEQTVNDRLDTVLGRIHGKLLHEAKMSVHRADKKAYERTAEIVDMMAIEITNKGL